MVGVEGRTLSCFLEDAAMRHFAALVPLVALVVAVPAAVGAQEAEPAYDRKTDNITFVGHEQFVQGTDMFFQRRDGRQHLDGEVIDGVRDFLFAGADASGAVGSPPGGEFVGVKIFDVTDPTAPIELAAIACGGYHADVQVYENYLIQSIDSAGTNTGCTPEFDPDGVDRAEVSGIRVLDIEDPANPAVAAFVTAETLENSVHNMTTLPWAGLLYVAGSSFAEGDPGNLTIVDLKDPTFPAKVIAMEAISQTAQAECHDIGVAQLEDQALAFCAAVHETFIWDVTDPMNPTHVSSVPLAVESIHHAARVAPDGTTLVLNDELGGAAAAPGCLATTQDPIGALWFYDISDPALPILEGTFSTAELAEKMPCTSHFYNFIPGTTLLTVGWYKSGMLVVDYGGLPQTSEHAVFTPTGGSFWSSYYWHGYVYGNSFGGGGLYGGTDDMGGVWITQLEGVGDVEPSPHDEGTSWARWTSQLPPASPPSDEPDPAPEVGADDQSNLPTTGGGLAAAALAALGVVALTRRRRKLA